MYYILLTLQRLIHSGKRLRLSRYDGTAKSRVMINLRAHEAEGENHQCKYCTSHILVFTFTLLVSFKVRRPLLPSLKARHSVRWGASTGESRP